MLVNEITEIFQFELENNNNFDLIDIKPDVTYSRISFTITLDFERHEFVKKKIDSLFILKFGSQEVITKEVANSVVNILRRLAKKCDMKNTDVRFRSVGSGKYTFTFIVHGIMN